MGDDYFGTCNFRLCHIAPRDTFCNQHRIGHSFISVFPGTIFTFITVLFSLHRFHWYIHVSFLLFFSFSSLLLWQKILLSLYFLYLLIPPFCTLHQRYFFRQISHLSSNFIQAVLPKTIGWTYGNTLSDTFAITQKPNILTTPVHTLVMVWIFC